MKILRKPPNSYNAATTDERDHFAIAVGDAISEAHPAFDVKVIIDTKPYARPPRIRIDCGENKVFNLTITRSQS